MQPPSERIRQAVRDALDEAATGARRFEQARGLRPWALRGLLDPDRRQVPSVDRAAEICDAVGLELTIAPRRPAVEADESGALRAVVEGAVKAQIDALRAEVAARPPEAPAATRQVEVVEIAAAAGGGAEAADERAVGVLAFRRDWLDEQGLDPTRCMVIRVHGASMEPTLPEGARILVDRARRERRARRLYVLRTGDGLVVKRAGRAGPGERGGWQLLSDNPAPDYPPLPWPDDAEIVGEVRWMARTFE